MKSAQELKHPGFVLFEGLDLTGKSSIARFLAERLKEFELQARYNTNFGFFDDVVDSELIKHMTPEEKTDYVLECYKQDSLPSDPRQFQELIQDRHAPCIFMYEMYRANQKLEDMRDFAKEYLKPKHIFLTECDFEERVRRAKKRSSLTLFEQKGIASEEVDARFRNAYREVIELFNVPYTILDTTSISLGKSVESCLAVLQDLDVLTHDVNVNELIVDFEPRVYPSTADLRFQEIKKGQKLKPIIVTRKIDQNGNYVDAIHNGRHRAYAAWMDKKDTIKAFINYESVDEIKRSRLKKLEEFGFK